MRRSYLGGHALDSNYINSLVKRLANESTNKKTKNELYRSNKKEIKRVIFNEPYTIVIWANGEKTIVKAQDGEPYDKAFYKFEKENMKTVAFKDIPRVRDFTNKYYCCSNCYKKLKKMIKDSITK